MEVAAAMVQCNGDPDESWTSNDSFWSRVAVGVYGENAVLARKALCMLWKQNRRDLRHHYFQQQQIALQRNKTLGVCTVYNLSAISINADVLKCTI